MLNQSAVMFIPKKIRVGFQNRPTTTEHGKLAYVIYFNEKNKLTKEKVFLDGVILTFHQ